VNIRKPKSHNIFQTLNAFRPYGLNSILAAYITINLQEIYYNCSLTLGKEAIPRVYPFFFSCLRRWNHMRGCNEGSRLVLGKSLSWVGKAGAPPRQEVM
jgi:hypothetical protein